MAYIGVQPTDTYLSIASQQITGDGGATYTLNYSVSDEESVAVFVNNVRQNVSSYTVSGDQLTLGGTISASDECWVLFLGRTVGTKTPAVGSVTGSMMSYPLTNFSSTGIDDNATSTAITIDSSERVGIHTSIPSRDLQVVDTGDGNAVIAIKSSNDTYSSVFFGDTSADNIGKLTYDHTDNSLQTIVNNAERMRIDSSGFAKHTTTGSYDTYSGADDSHQFVSDNNGHSTLWITNQNASYSSHAVLRVETNRLPDSGFQFLTTTTGNLTDDQHRLRGDGNAYADGSWNGGGADYAEYFEWLDGNSSNEDRVGYSVILEGDKIRKATDTDNTSKIIGVISGNPFVVGDTSWNKWSEKYLRDDFGRYLQEEYTITEWEEEVTEEGVTKIIKKSFETDKIPAEETVPNDATVLTQEVNGENFKRNVLNPDYDETLEYIPREDRKEWSTVGLLGKLRIRKGQPVGDRWIKMRDISETVEEWLIK